MNEQVYFDTLGQAVDGITLAADARRVCLLNPESVWEAFSRPLNYPQGGQLDFARGSFEIRTLRDKPTRKFFNAVIYRLDSGNYELNCYIL
jgi:hypothetical protein